MSQPSAAAAARVGLVRLIGSFGYGDLPPQPRDEIRAKTATADYASGWIDEFVQANASGAEAVMLTDFGDKPLVVLTAGAETDATHDAAQNKLATLSSDSSHRVVDGRQPYRAHHRRAVRQGHNPGHPRRRVLSPNQPAAVQVT